ncbi:MAG: N-acetylneuraminate synthase family protein, partial [Bacteroidia bacterium]
MSAKKVYIIAEAGVNHNGSIDMAYQLIDKAKEIGADCVKFQTFKAEQIVTASSPKANYQLKVTDA